MSYLGLEEVMGMDSPFGENSIFHVTYTNKEGVSTPNLTNISKYSYQIFSFKSGLDALEAYENMKEADIEDNYMYIFVEEKSEDTSNIFGTVCRVRMGNKFREYLKRVSNGYETTVNDYKIRGLYAFCKAICDKDEELLPKYSLLINAVSLEYFNTTDLNKFLKEVFSTDEKIADWINSGVEAIEKWKFTEENYNYDIADRKNKYKPILPVTLPQKMANGATNVISYTTEGLGMLVELSEKIEEKVFSLAERVAHYIPGKADDYILALIKVAKEKLNELLFEKIKNVISSVKEILQQAVDSVNKLIKGLGDLYTKELAIINAFLCGILNGLISTVQLIMSLVALLIDNISFIEMEDFSPEKIAEQQKKLEFVEDLVDVVRENGIEVFDKLVTYVSTSEYVKDFIDLAKMIVKKVKGYNIYSWAYFLGNVAFEIILDAVIAYFSGGASVTAKISSKISRLATKAEEMAAKGIKIATNIGAKVADTATALLKWIKKEFVELIEAIKNGKLVEWLRDKLKKLFGIENKPADAVLLEEWDDVAIRVSGRGRRFGQIMSKSDIRKVKRFLKKHKVELELFPENGSYTIKGLALELSDNAQAAFIISNDGKKLKMCLRKGCTVYEFFHELMHLRHSRKIGVQNYLNLVKFSGRLEKERWVFDALMRYKEYLTHSEVDHAFNYIKDLYKRNGKLLEDVGLLKKELYLEKVPKVRKKVKIEQIINITE
ncbi:hypothetical protein NBRC110019_24980 [Neptunitalea chrysea]|uniref:Tox-MPTase4 domain-containing protein n=1 Tax=Neptunitalea chrysea TaxID=1647581 RepID=A0A9W6B8E8_9FLAO|nr:zincin-like metallopeptidase toxin domain-containing protein [Neptunitalea chrysea]GLB53457.1 hypothetical protein NBRC110019_24980 [Neptunitalea chrysea]